LPATEKRGGADKRFFDGKQWLGEPENKRLVMLATVGINLLGGQSLGEKEKK